ncbi:hypothetical protein A3D78_05225 [Candidatus Gottesmanbacteria bacterium RIFCSPHIGHO2_02_FULL_39_14]|uniref:Glycosyltransferase RgtA/B/C/D-like domain-containing protein n=1 Tax=Candidatus Gottesmanbacteria bacterium RIFCSPHIGHO2_02_FULL_39_14 TaxID=1798383 RepID=A0A1F5ZYS1_9BACT|nr:MAG: hypothetical protein A3D78_05225 [Candidatus Gottesmanbacteria bacterium RIFCSPHIGHO2_02_FULL_39_14]
MSKIFFTRSFVIYFFFSQILIILSNTSLILHQINQPPLSVYPLVNTEWTHDFYLYLSVVTQGKSGSWLYSETYTSEPTKPGFFLFYYILVGKMAALFNLWPPVAYHLARIISLEFFILLVYLLCYQILGQRLAILGAGLSLFTGLSPLPLFKETLNLQFYPAGYPWWMSFDTLERLNGFPHHIFGQAILLLTVIAVIHFVRTQKWRFAICSAFLSLIGGLLFPPILGPLVVCLSLGLIIYSLPIIRKLFWDKWKLIAGILLIIAASSAAYLMVIWQQHQGFPWNQWASNELIRWNTNEPNFNYSLFFFFGILPVIVFPTVIKSVFSRRFEDYLILFWAIYPFMLLPFATTLGLPKIRLLQEAPVVPLGILAGASIGRIIPKTSGNIFRLVIIVAVITFGLPSIITIFQERLSTLPLFVSGHHFHIPRPTYNAIKYMEDNLKPYSLILSEQMMGNIIPAFIPVKTYVGHFTHTINFYQKEQLTRSFFAQTMKESEAKKLLVDNNISYVYQGENERLINNILLKYSFLEKIYEKDEIILYKVL